MLFQRIDATDDLAFASWFDVFSRSEMARPGRQGQGWHPEEWRARSINENAAKIWHLLTLGETHDHPLGVAAVEVGRDDNLHWVRGELHVDPPVRRRGIGTALLAQLENYTRQLGRPRLVVGVMEGAEEVGRAPNRFFAPQHGYSVADEAVRRDLAWPRPDGALDELDAAWRQHAGGYEILSWTGPTPARWVGERAHLSAVMPAEAPYANLDVEAELWDESRVRQHEEETDAMGRELFVAAARHIASDALVGYSELTVSRDFTDNAYQWDTLVVGAHRGHRLGGLLKVATMRLLEESRLPVKVISTFNSSLNEAMIRVNEQLGAHVAGSSVMWRKDL